MIDRIPNVLLVETDNPSSRRFMETLDENGVRVTPVSHHLGSLPVLESQSDIDLLLMDESNFETRAEVAEGIQNVRRVSPLLRIVMRGSSVDSPDIVPALNAGADYYISKKEDGDTVSTLIKASLRRRDQYHPDTFRGKLVHVGDVEIELARHIVTKAGFPISLTPTEYAVVAFLAFNVGKAIPTEDITKRVWRDTSGDPKLARDQISSLRKKLGEKRGKYSVIQTFSGFGYRLANPAGPE